MNIIRVFPRLTKATPIDPGVRIAGPPGFLAFDFADEIHISVAFSWDLPVAEKLAKQWSIVAPVRIGGPALGESGGEFEPGKYLKKGYVITSRGCPNKCWFCEVWKREGNIRELEIKDGYNILDDNLLACSRRHIENVFSMLAKQKEKPEFTGGLEAARLEPWHAKEMKLLKTKQVFFAYDSEDKLKPLIEAGKIMSEAGFTKASHSLRCYVLCGFPKDKVESAERRMRNAIAAGFMPMAMLYRNKKGDTLREWRAFQREWARPAIMSQYLREK